MRGSVFLLVALAPAAMAETMTQTVPFDYDVNFGVAFPVVQGFDTQGGARELTRVTFDIRNNVTLELFVESTGPTPLIEGDYALDAALINIFQLGLPGEKGDPPPPGFGTGGFFIDGISGDLAAYDGTPGNDGPDSFRRVYNDSFTSTQTFGLDEPTVLDALTDVGPLTTVFGGFTELFFEWFNDPGWPFPPGGVPEYPNDAAIWVSTPTYRHFGEIDVTYEFTTVPEPAGLVIMMAGAAIWAVRRR